MHPRLSDPGLVARVDGGATVGACARTRWRRIGRWLSSSWPWIAPLCVAQLLLLPWLGSMPGLHLDEAWTLGRIDELVAGQRPLSGMTFYTGALHAYLVWPFVAVFGPGVVALRMLGVIANVAAVGFVAATTRRLVGDRAGLAAGLLLATAPAFVAFSRFAIEVTALSPLLAALAFTCFVESRQRKLSHSLLLAFMGGIPLGLIAYNHVVQLPIVAAAALAVLVHSRGRLFLWPQTYAAGAGCVVGAAPRLVELARADGLLQWGRGNPEFAAFLPDLRHLPDLLLRCWDGSLIYQRFAGGSWLPVLPYPVAAFAAIWTLRYVHARARPSRTGVVIFGTIIFAAISIAAIAPHLALRYFVVVHLALAVMLAIVAVPLLQDANQRASRATGVILGTVIALNMLYVASNLFAPFLFRGGGVSTFTLGTRLLETSNHLIRTDGLYAALKRDGVRRIDANPFIAEPLKGQARAAGDGSLDFRAPQPDQQNPNRPLVRTALVFWNGPTAQGFKPWDGSVDVSRWETEIERDGMKFRLAADYPTVFRVYLSPEK